MEEEVEEFLRKWKIALNNNLRIIPRDENKRSMAEMKIEESFAKIIMATLTYRDYVSGPEYDKRGDDSDIWIFGVEPPEKDYQIYIKIKIYEIKKKLYAKCISFHKANHQMSFPLRY